MDKLEITTSHNIVVSVELANVAQRILATIIDGFILMIYASFAGLITLGSQVGQMLLVVPVLMCYHLIMEYFFDGQSLGKMLLKLRVISLRGDRPELLDLVMRWMFRLIDITASVGILAIIFATSSKKKQRLGDILANTAVVRIQNDSHVALESIKELSDDSYTISYPLVTMYNDKDMLLVKEAIGRYQKKPTANNSKLLSDLSSKIHRDFKLKGQVSNKLGFLRKVLNDYIMLTR